MKHRYPKTRKPRITDYAKSSQLIKSLGVEHLKQIFDTIGMYRASRQISELTGKNYSPYVIRYTRSKVYEICEAEDISSKTI